MQIVILLGSVRAGRQTYKITDYLETQLAQQPGVDVNQIDLRTAQLPIFHERWQKQDEPQAELLRLSQLLTSADAIIFASPEYHGSYTGVLKNAIDHYRQEFSRKPIGVVATGAGRFGGINASTEMQRLILSIGGFPMPYKLLVPNIMQAFSDDLQPQDEQLEKSVERFIQEFLWFARAITTAREAIPAPGQ
jgi:azobenzene reductase